ncbi:hypothetical protein THAOC_14814 [Thalassiosira oceanica]|uniref:Uncharacterized protein n=1 Tax=Thalassiosira oceanica TaxID=159749 RepID=K0SE82_THAOC|nr:hypothetical protein THAOC_14814 [Thalassiosira oceanica]|eukprot:EJK64448.1 hypothetical protein THAOC_14814 [Thalassiosira oceanica]
MEPRRRRIEDDRAVSRRGCAGRGGGSVIRYRWAGQCSRSSSRGVRRLEEEAEEASSRGMKSGDGEDRGHSSRVLSNMMSAIHDEPHQVGDDTEDDREENYAGSVVKFWTRALSTYPG